MLTSSIIMRTFINLSGRYCVCLRWWQFWYVTSGCRYMLLGWVNALLVYDRLSGDLCLCAHCHTPELRFLLCDNHPYLSRLVAACGRISHTTVEPLQLNKTNKYTNYIYILPTLYILFRSLWSCCEYNRLPCTYPHIITILTAQQNSNANKMYINVMPMDTYKMVQT